MPAPTASRSSEGRSAALIASRRLMAGALWGLTWGGASWAFPLVDLPGVHAGAPGGITDLAAPDAADLRNQLQIANALPAAAPGWTITPRIGFEEILSDNVTQVHSPRQWDLSTLIAPGIAIEGNTRRVKLNFDYSPSLVYNARTTSNNAIGQQMTGIGSITAIDELAFIDVRTAAGVQSGLGGLGGGAIGASETGGLTALGNAAGLTAANQNASFQTTSAGVSPYLQHQFGDYGSGRLGYSLNMSQTKQIKGTQFNPFPSGAGGQTLISQEINGNYNTGNLLDTFQNTVQFSASQSRSTFGGGNGLTTTAANPYSSNSSTTTFSDQVSAALSHSLSVQVSAGHETIKYSGGNQRNIDGMTWQAGGTWVPNPDSSITLSYGHQNGADSLSFDGHYQLSARTSLSGSYHETLGTQLQNLQQQLQLATPGANGGLINGVNGGPGFVGTSALGLQPGVFRTKTFNVSATNVQDRDSFTLTMTLSDQTVSGQAVAGQVATLSKSGTVSWSHEIKPDLRLSSSFSLNLQNGGVGGTGNSWAANTGVFYALSSTVTTSLRYSHFTRTGSAAIFNIDENQLVAGLTKKF